jgi:ABC-2 type transport system ATP-binding protein
MKVEEVPTLRAPGAGPIPSAIEVSGLTKIYQSRRRGPVVAVDNLSFSVRRGELVGLLGPNGAGKTTTIKSLCTLIRPTSGSILIEGEDAVRTPRAAVANVAAVLEGNRNVYWRMTPVENLELFAGLNGIPPGRVKVLIDELLERFDLGSKRKAEARTLSRGMQQKLAVACAFVKQTPVLLLDEPTLGLDVETSHDLRETLKQMGGESERTILLSSHDMDVVQDICRRVIIINEGRIVTDDEVGNLLDVFRVRAYRFTLQGRMDEQKQSQLCREFPHSRVESDTHQTVVDVEFGNGKQIYDLVETLRSFGEVIESIDRTDPDLEEIFLRIVHGVAAK